jgi:hypothetical protein
MSRSVLAIFRMIDTITTLVVVIIVVVAGFGIAITLVLLVSEKRGTIGVLKAAGMTPQRIALGFLAAGLLIAGAGILLGELAGWLGVEILDRTPTGLRGYATFVESETFPMLKRWDIFALAAVAAFVVVLFASWFPARRAARLDLSPFCGGSEVKPLSQADSRPTSCCPPKSSSTADGHSSWRAKGMLSSPQTLWGFFGAGIMAAVAHALLPSHWLPFLAAARAQGWSRRQLFGFTLLVAIAHALVTVSLGFIVAVLGTGVTHFFHEHAPKIAGLILIGLGVLFLAFPRLSVTATFTIPNASMPITGKRSLWADCF